mmetsp:Transcript_85898/g.243615  ORF Transcript_85898/g.243615 Transcript_85898/m.243615 type:complete len:145 (+) Transcript_85898:117-551(+)
MGMACCTELQNGKMHERPECKSPRCDPGCKDAQLVKEPRPPLAADAKAAQAEKASAQQEAILQKQREADAAARIQAKFRGQKTRESVSQMRENVVVQHYQDPELSSVDPANIMLQSQPNRMSSSPQEISPRTLAAFNSMPMRQR